MSGQRVAVRVAVCVATFGRPEGLKRLLHSLRRLSFDRPQDIDWSVVVVDNDPALPNRSLLEFERLRFPVSLIYGVEPTPGIASARNRAITLAGEVEYVAFIDDDEVADAGWLDNLVQTRSRHNAHVVAGPVLPEFERPVPDWIRRGAFFERPRSRTGTLLASAATHNVLIQTDWLRTVDGPFDERLNLTGGSDSLFFAQIARMGARMVWSDEAIVREYNPPGRVSVRWLVRRAFRLGNVLARVECTVAPTAPRVMTRVLKALGHATGGVVMLLPAVFFRGYAGLVRSIMFSARGLGEIAGLLGIYFEEYRDLRRSRLPFPPAGPRGSAPES